MGTRGLLGHPPDAEDAVDVVPDGPAQHGGVDAAVHGDGVVGEVVHHLELLVQQLPHVGVQAVDEGVAVVLPGVILPEKKCCWAGRSVGDKIRSQTPLPFCWGPPQILAAEVAPAWSQPRALGVPGPHGMSRDPHPAPTCARKVGGACSPRRVKSL